VELAVIPVLLEIGTVSRQWAVMQAAMAAVLTLLPLAATGQALRPSPPD
jgi:hypothetical protein